MHYKIVADWRVKQQNRLSKLLGLAQVHKKLVSHNSISDMIVSFHYHLNICWSDNNLLCSIIKWARHASTRNNGTKTTRKVSLLHLLHIKTSSICVFRHLITFCHVLHISCCQCKQSTRAYNNLLQHVRHIVSW